MQSEIQLSFDFHAAEPKIITDSAEGLKLKLGDFAGPLDLLLFLIKQEKASIFDIPIARITDEYLRYIKLMEQLDITVAADFLVMATTLIEIKSKMLLPKSPAENQEEPIEEDPRQELVKQLLEYEKFKIAAQMLWERAVVEQSIFRRGKTEYDDDKNSVINVGVFELFEAFRKVLERKSNADSIELEKEQISLEEVIDKLKKKLNEQGILSFNQISKAYRTKIQLILSFLAILEIVRTENVILIQQRPFDDVLLKKVNIV